MSLSSPGPRNRGNCYFFGQISSSTTMWQTIYLNNTVAAVLIDSLTVNFRLSAWIGGWEDQNDNAKISLTFLNQFSQQVGYVTNIGPVSASDRNYISMMLYREAGGVVPIGARVAKVLVTFTRTAQKSNDGSVDNIALVLHQ
ncbi:unnamed protein product [Rotaria sordida]|nr:unnamed protein product [Rotaria sordida]CAF1169654.1 unnamed protein product [Rotaria sordida]